MGRSLILSANSVEEQVSEGRWQKVERRPSAGKQLAVDQMCGRGPCALEHVLLGQNETKGGEASPLREKSIASVGTPL